MLDQYFIDDKLIYYLCRIRAKYAKQRSKQHLLHLLSTDKKLNHHVNKNEEEKFLQKILPPRRKWKKLSKKHRYKNIWQKINSIEYNAKCIFKTIKYYKKTNPNEPFIIELTKFIAKIQGSLNDPNYRIKTPSIYPKLKDNKGANNNACRPISLFDLKDKIIISQTNKYLTEIFDTEFYELSHAFRAPIKIPGEKKELITHHNSIAEILEYKSKYRGKQLWVAECDMSKFYDSVNHSIIKNQFNKIASRVNRKNSHSVDARAIKVFKRYLAAYNFVKDVLPKNKDDDYWKRYKLSKQCNFGWVKNDFLRLGYYKRVGNAKIGIPQGGALSGLIANVVLDYADNEIKRDADKRLLYIRFCDDMVVMHPSKKACKEAVYRYARALKKLKLVPHPFKNGLRNKSDSFWHKSIKSKDPYKWTAAHWNNKNFPWIGFVGYEVHFNGHIRIRKSSLRKELQKQKEVVNKINNAIQNDNKRKRNGTVLESAANRLIGMSVGRVQMWNHNNIEHEMCWVNGFHKLHDNPFLKKQLKHLDKNRNSQMVQLKKEVSKYQDEDYEEEEVSRPRRKLIYHGKPYSYYYHVVEKKKNKT